MDLDKNWFRGGVAMDVYKDLRRKETELTTFGDYKGSKHLSAHRRRIIDWMLEVNRSLEKSHSERHHHCRNQHSIMLNTRSIHLAVYLFDYFLNLNYVVSDHIWLVAATSMIVAAKFEVQHSCVPSPKLMNQHIQTNQRRGYQLSDFIRVEWMLLKCVEWRLHVPLSVDFLQYYETSFEIIDNHRYSSSPNSILSVYSTPAHRMCTPSPEPSSIIVDDWKNTADFLISYSLKDLAFRIYKPSMIAGAAVAAARWYHHLQPYWSKKLTEISGYSCENLNNCLRHLVKKIESERQHNPSSFPSPICDLNTSSASSSAFRCFNPPVPLPVSSPARLPTPTISPELEYSAPMTNYSSPSTSAMMNSISAQSFGVQFTSTMNTVPQGPQYIAYGGGGIVDSSMATIGQRQPPIGSRLPPIRVQPVTQNVAYGCFTNGQYAAIVPREAMYIPSTNDAVYHTANAVPVFHIIGTLAQTDNGRIVYLVKNNVGFCQTQTTVAAPVHPAPIAPAPLPTSNYEMINYDTNSVRQQNILPAAASVDQHRGPNCFHSYSNVPSVDVTASNHNYQKLIGSGPYTRSMKRSLGVAGSEILTELDHTKTKRIRRK